MYLIETTKAFRKDVKAAKKRGKNLEKLKYVIKELSEGNSLPEKYKDHKLAGDYVRFRECHIEPDWLLIYRIEKKFLLLTRTGTHSDLFE